MASLPPADHQDALVGELASAASSPQWRDRYAALERTLELPALARRQVAARFIRDTNSWVRALAESLADDEARPAVRTRRGIVQDFDQVLKGAKLTLTQRTNLIRLFEDIQQAGAVGYLALSADRAARLVTAAMNVVDDERVSYLRDLERFIRHMAAYASPPSAEAEPATISEILGDVGSSDGLSVSVERSVDATVDGTALKTGLDEILANSRDAGARRIRVNVVRSNGAVRTVVANDGEAIESSAEQHLFEPWYTTRAGRAGLGLYLARLAARKAGGDLVHHSGSESSFEIELPVIVR